MKSFEWAEECVDAGLSGRSRMAGYYNNNYLIWHNGRDYLFRIPIANYAKMDLRRIDENRIPRYLDQCKFPAPRLLYDAKTSGFSVHAWIEGATLNDVHRGETRVPDWVPKEVARQMARLHQLSPVPFEKDCQDLAKTPDTPAFFLAHYTFDRDVHRRLLPEMRAVYDALGIPRAPFEGLDARNRHITPRPFCLCHSDIHRKNIILGTEPETLVLLDWELVLVGDPFYDIAVHFHKMRYMPDQEARFIEAYVSTSQLPFDAVSVRREIDEYLALERVKSVVIDAYRVRGDLTSGKLPPKRARDEVARYATKLAKAAEIWSGAETYQPPSIDRLYKILSS